MRKLLLILIGSVSLQAADPKTVIELAHPKGIAGFIHVGIKHPPAGKRFALMFSKDFKSWSIAKDSSGRKCIEALPSTTKRDGLTIWWCIAMTTNEGFYRVSR